MMLNVEFDGYLVESGVSTAPEGVAESVIGCDRVERFNMDDRIFDFAYMMAFRDSTLRKAFQRREDEKEDDFHNRKEKIKNHSRPIVQNYIDSIIKSGVPDKLDEYLDPLSVIKSLCDEENTELGFTFGNAQKLVNMTAKYMFLSSYGDEQKREMFKTCHCPMDGAMMERLKEKREKYALELKRFEISWSRLGIDDKSMKEYERFQGYINQIAEKEKVYPIEVDFMLWDE